jgi:UDP-glucose 4-epimerase
MSQNILVCGGAGYIGSHMIKMLAENGHNVTTFDNLSTGHRHAVKWGRLIEGDLLNPTDLQKLFAEQQFDLVMHFSARSLVGESVQNPALYYQNNVVGTFNLLEAMHNADVDKFIFSSTAATYGYPQQDLIDEEHPTIPINPYGQTKLMVEKMLEDYAAAYGLKSVRLRYFNAAGADFGGQIGEEHDPETHLIPNVLKSILPGSSTQLKVFGDDYDTPDGTCVRDYIHVNDLCDAHLKAADYLQSHAGSTFFNLGNGAGFSVKQIINAAEKVTGQTIQYAIEERRAGDPAVLVANAARAKAKLGWQPAVTDLAQIIESAWNWHKG